MSLIDNDICAPGYVIHGSAVEDLLSNTISGHGTYKQTHVSEDGNKSTCVISCVAGSVERVNKLVSVCPLTSRYPGNIGDIIVGKVTSVGDDRWKVNVNGSRDAQLLLSATFLPNGDQRRKTEADQINMRNMFSEHDLITAEVQKVHHSDGSIVLHTRSEKYGRIDSPGILVKVKQNLVRRCKQHFVTLSCGVPIILGSNGFIWITEGGKGAGSNIDSISRIRNAILALDAKHLSIHPSSIDAVIQASLFYKVSPSQMTTLECRVQIVEAAMNQMQE